MHASRTLLSVAAAASLALLGWLPTGSTAGGLQDPLSADASVGRVLDREGSAGRRAVLADRWGAIDQGSRLATGDWLRTGARGANALRLALASGTELVLGPGGLLEVTDGGRVTLGDGELEVVPEGVAVLTVAGPGGASVEVRERAVLRAHDGVLTRLDEAPRWLEGYRSDSSSEALGSLLCEIDGRNVPLTMGYHQVTVDVRDQIARTVIEESFENHTDHVLEGVFYFPLPADASISGFGMWIDGELVQGDIVEKERAREIYETILREKRDPGLLEWAGGNVFKARVYPIGDEKRIRIAYTQVLPKEGDSYRYRYALQSDLLRQHPLRQLRIQVDVSSTEPLAEVRSPSHACRVQASEHAARLEFEAQEYTPDRDFELVVRSAAPAGGVTLVPHRRGDDGYFMLLFTPPVDPSAGAKQRAEPLDLLVLADTSGSLWGPPREAQVSFLETLLGALSERDTFDLATCDVETLWAFGRPTAATAEARERALRHLDAREPLGWSDLGAAFGQAIERAGPGTQVVYVGDGAQTAGDPEPAAFAARLERRYGGQGTFHAVVPGTTSEALAIDTIAALGGGSQRGMDGDPAAAAFALLEELTTPAVKGLQLSFEGLEVAAVHPARLPNLPAGRQQIVLGRFDPRGGDLAGRVRVRGTLGGEPVELAADVRIAADDEGNSFVPRLWARRHLDHLLRQGASAEIRERVIALSEDFQIVTPYTSFLVLESDADRERFGVQKRFRMRDGEEFFAEGRDSARHELLAQQMRKAKGWRRRLQARTLESLEDMGRGLTEALRPPGSRYEDTRVLSQLASLGYGAGSGGGGGVKLAFEGESANRAWDADGGDLEALEVSRYDRQAGEELLDDGPFEPALEEPAEERLGMVRKRVARPSSGPASPGPGGPAASSEFFLGRGQSYRGPGDSVPPGWYSSRPQLPEPFGGLFPAVPGPRGADPELRWDPALVELLATLDRRPAILQGPGGWSFEVEAVGIDLRGHERGARSSHLLGADAWLVRGDVREGRAYPVEWLRGGERGAWIEGWKLGRTRPAEDGDERSWRAPIAGHFGDQLAGFIEYEATLEELEEGRVRVVAWHPSSPERKTTLVIDRARGLLLESGWSVRGEPGPRTVYGAFQEVGGRWWPGEITSTDAEGRVTRRTTVRIEALARPALEQRIAAGLAGRDEAILLGPDPDDLQAAKQAVREGGGTLEQRWLLLRHLARTQRWERAAPHLAAIEELCAGKLGLEVIRAAYLQHARRNEELRRHLLALAGTLAETPHEAELDLFTQVLGYGSQLNQGNEMRALLVPLKSLVERHPDDLDAQATWDQRMLQALQNMQRPDELFAHWQAMAAAYSEMAGIQAGFATELARRGEVDAAIARLDAAERERGPWTPPELNQLRYAVLDILWNGYRLEQLVETCERWQREDPDRTDQQAADRHLSALVFLDREEEAERHTDAWLALAERDELSDADRARLQAAVQRALGGGYGFWRRGRFEDAELERLAAAVRRLARRDELSWLASQVLSDWWFRRSDPAQVIFAELWQELSEGVLTLPPQRLQARVQWLRNADWKPEDGDEGWDALLEKVYTRWLTEGTDGDPLEQVVVGHGSRDLVLRHHRKVLRRTEAGTEQRVQAAQSLHTYLLQGEWSQESEDEAFGLLDDLRLAEPQDEEAAERNLELGIVALYDTVSWVFNTRTEAALRARPDFNTLTRRQLKAAREYELREVIGVLNRRLSPLDLPGLTPWRMVEMAWASSKMGTPFPPPPGMLQGLTELAAKHAEHVEDDDVPLGDRVLALRRTATLIWWLVSLTEEERGILGYGPDDLLTLFQQGIDSGSALMDWREATYTLLLVLDRADELQDALSAWYGAGEDLERVRWGHDLAFVAAERGELERAAALLEEVGALDELSHDDLRALADWTTVLDRPEAARDARIRSWEALGEWGISQRLQRDVQSQQRLGDEPPPELDPEAPLRLIALLRKAERPANQLWSLQQLYASTKDFRLLECVPEGVLGHSAQAVYPFLRSASNLFNMVQEEATVDRLQAHLVAMREGERTVVDRRALHLLEFAMLRRAADQSHGTERHVEGALAALKAARKGEWVEGEPGLMADYLAGEGRMRQELLAGEQLTILRELVEATDDPDERLGVSGHLAATLWAYERRDEAVRTLSAALDALRAASGGRLPVDALVRLDTLGSWLQAVGSFRAAEAMWLAEIEAGHPEERRLGLVREFHECYRDAVLARAEVSLGAGDRLYPAVLASFRRELGLRTHEDHARRLIATLCDLWRRAHADLRLRSAATDATQFAFSDLPSVLALYQYRGGQDMVRDVAECLEHVRDARTVVEFLVVRAETEPPWLRLVGQDFWQQHGRRLVEQRSEAGSLSSELASRVLAVFLRELRADLRSGQGRNRSGYHQELSHFWSERRAEFRRAALEVLRERRESGALVAHIAEYLYRGLGAHDEAIAALLDGWRRELLDVPGRRLLAEFLQEQGRWAESLPVVTGLIADEPAAADLRARLVRALFHTEGREAAAQALEQAEAALRELEAWNEEAVATLAVACGDSELLEHAVRLWDEAIAVRTRTAPNRGVGDGTLARYWREKADLLSRLGRTVEAVDAAAGAVVAWGSSQDERGEDLRRLHDVLAQAADLDGYVAHLDAEVAESGLENPILRKAIGQVYLEERAFEQAAAQLRAALEVQPDDAETADLLIAACDGMGRPELAVEALLERARSAAHDVELTTRLGKRYLKLEQVGESERAFTSLVEAMPNESEGYQRLAEVRQDQRRWDEAAAAWEGVVRVRSTEPTGYLGRAECLLRLERWAEVRQVARTLLAGAWPERFGDVHAQAEALLRRIPRDG